MLSSKKAIARLGQVPDGFIDLIKPSVIDA